MNAASDHYGRFSTSGPACSPDRTSAYGIALIAFMLLVLLPYQTSHGQQVRGVSRSVRPSGRQLNWAPNEVGWVVCPNLNYKPRLCLDPAPFCTPSLIPCWPGNLKFQLQFENPIPIRFDKLDALTLRVDELPTLDISHRFPARLKTEIGGTIGGVLDGTVKLDSTMSGAINLDFDDNANLGVNGFIQHAVTHNLPSRIIHDHQFQASKTPFVVRHVTPKVKPDTAVTTDTSRGTCPFKTPADDTKDCEATPPLNHFLIALAFTIGTAVMLVGCCTWISNHQSSHQFAPKLNIRRICETADPSPMGLLNSPLASLIVILTILFVASCWTLHTLAKTLAS